MTHWVMVLAAVSALSGVLQAHKTVLRRSIEDGEGNEQQPATDSPRRIKGEQMVKQTMLSKVVGGDGLTDEFLAALASNATNLPAGMKLVTGGNNSMPYLVTEKLQTSVTRITIPLSTSFMDSEWYRETLKKFLVKNKIGTGSRPGQYSETGPDVELVSLKLWAAATLRDNMLAVFGYLLHHPAAGRLLPGDLHSALTHITAMVRLRRVPLVTTLEVLQDMSFEDPREQFQILFEKLEMSVPRHLRSCVTYWLEWLHGPWGSELNSILLDPRGSLAASLLSGIDSSALPALAQPVLFPKEVVLAADQHYVEHLGKMMACLLASLSTGKVVLTQQLFGAMLLQLPLNMVQPQAEEYLHYLVDSLRKGGSGALRMDTDSDPFVMTRQALQLLAPEQIITGDQMAELSSSVEAESNTFDLAGYELMSRVVGAAGAGVDMELLLSAIVPGEYPADVVDAKDRLLYYLDNNYIDLAAVQRGFVKHKYTSVMDLLLAVLSRMEVRSPSLPKEVKQTVGALKAHVSFKRGVSAMRPTLQVVDVTELLSAFQSPLLPEPVTTLAHDIQALLDTELPEHRQLIPQQNMSDCSRPRKCAVTVLKKMLTNPRLRNKQAETKIRELLKMVDDEGEPRVAQRRFLSGGDCEPEISPRILGDGVQRRKSEIYPGKFSPGLYKGAQYNYPIYVSRDGGEVMIFSHDIQSLFQAEVAELSELPLESLPVPHPGLRSNGTAAMELLPQLEDAERLKLGGIPKVLNTSLMETWFKEEWSQDATAGPLLLRLLRRALDKARIPSADTKLVGDYVKVLEFVYKTLPPPPPPASSQRQREVDYGSLLQAIPPPRKQEDIARLQLLRDFMLQKDFAEYLEGFDVTKYATKGLLLRQVLTYLADNEYLLSGSELRAAIRDFKSKVRVNGYGGQPVEWLLVVETSAARSVDIKDILGIIDLKSLPRQGKKSFAVVKKFLETDWVPSRDLAGLDLTAHETKGGLLQALLEHLARQPLAGEVVAAMDHLKTFVGLSDRAQELIQWQSE